MTENAKKTENAKMAKNERKGMENDEPAVMAPAVMTVEEARAWLDSRGIGYEVCDTPVPYFRNGVPAGYPTAPGDYDGDYEMVPKALLKVCDFIVSVTGDSMRDADIHDGDDVIVKRCGDYDDGDIVVACLDGETTLKSVCHDDDGEVWLVPANDAYRPIRLSDYENVYLLGRVTGVRKCPRRMSYAEVHRRLKAARQSLQTVVTDERVYEAVTQVLADIRVGRMWFCIYRVLADVGYLRQGDYEGLKTCMDRLFPDNDFKINPHDISRMDVDSFAKSVSLWNEMNAPVGGKRFREYRQLAMDFYRLVKE